MNPYLAIYCALSICWGMYALVHLLDQHPDTGRLRSCLHLYLNIAFAPVCMCFVLVRAYREYRR